MTDDTIPTGDPTTVPISELEELAAEWDNRMLDEILNGYEQAQEETRESCINELQDLINEHDPKQ